jgi:hypothetical protein
MIIRTEHTADHMRAKLQALLLKQRAQIRGMPAANAAIHHHRKRAALQVVLKQFKVYLHTVAERRNRIS